jgi:hypothetical protein
MIDSEGGPMIELNPVMPLSLKSNLFNVSGM